MNIGFDNAIAFVTIFGLLVFLHEFGHFVVAKWCGIHVEVFSLGFGPRLFGWRGPQTDYRVSLVPLGGYVKMRGEGEEADWVADPRDRGEPEGEAGENGVVPGSGDVALGGGEPPAPDDQQPRESTSFADKPRLQRFLVMVAGATMNVILAILIVTGMNMAGRQDPAHRFEPPRVAGLAAGSPAEKAGLQRGDRIVAVDGEPMDNWDVFQQQVLFNPGRQIVITVDRDGAHLDLPVEVTLPPEDTRLHRYRIGYIGLQEAAYDVRVWQVTADSPAAAAGIREGDILVTINGETILTAADVVRMVEPRAGTPIQIQLRRDGELVELEATPADNDGKGLLGIAPGPTIKIRKLGLVDAFSSSIRISIERTGLFFTVVGKLLSGGLSVRAVSGPVDIFIFSGEALRRGWFSYFDLMALFSLQLGILNLLPIPFLDGGHIAILGVEGVLRRDLPDRFKERLLQFGFVVLLLFMGVVLYSDIAKNMDLLFGWLQ